MKKNFLTMVLILSMLLISSCGQKTASFDTFSVSSSDLSHIDVDLTELSSTMVYSEVYNIMSSPEDYIGKTMKVRGMYYSWYSDDGTVSYPACVIQDATACCQQGIEFVLDSGDYPEEGDEVTVIGTFDSYVDKTDNLVYYHLVSAKLV